MAKHTDYGKWGEKLAEEYLVKQGYSIAVKNWRLKPYEIDIVAINGPRIIFVEVKTRNNIDHDPMDAVTPRKMQHLVSAANAYIHENNVNLEPQFDIVAIRGNEDQYELEHIPDAFVPALKSYR